MGESYRVHNYTIYLKTFRHLDKLGIQCTYVGNRVSIINAKLYKMLNTPQLISPNCTKLIEDSNAEEQERKPAIACDFLLLFTVHAVHCFAD